MNLKPIHQQVVVVVGCTSGIGLETALQFARRGAKLVLAGRGEDDLLATFKAVRAEGVEAVTVEADVTELEQMHAVANAAVEKFGRIDTWAHIAGVPLYAKVEDINPEDFRRVLDVNLNGVLNGILAALPHLKREGQGALIVVSSVDARIPLPYQGPYVASKQGLQGLLDTLRIELKHDGYPITVTNIKPATISTPFFEKAKTYTGFEPDLLPPIYNARSVADAIVYAAAHPVRELNVGGASTIFQASRKISPALTDSAIQLVAFKGQESEIAKSPEDDNNLWGHIEGYHRVEGKKPGMYSKATWLDVHPAAKWSLRALLLAGIPMAAALLIRSRRKAMRKSWSRKTATRVTGFVSDLLNHAGWASALASLVAHFRQPSSSARRMQHAKQALRSAGQSVAQVAERVSHGRKRTLPEKTLSKVQEIMPKGIHLSQALEHVKDITAKLPTGKKRAPSMLERVKETIRR